MLSRRKICECGLVALLGIALLLAGCTKYSEVSTEYMHETAGIEMADAIVEANTSEAETLHIEETISDNLRIDADVTGYPADGQAAVYNGEEGLFSKEDIDAFIESFGISVTASKEWDDGSEAYYSGDCENGYSFSYMYGLNGMNNCPYSTLAFRSKERYERYREYPIYSNEESYETNAMYTVGWMFAEPKELSFAAASEAEADIRDTLEYLGLTQLVLLRTLYIDYETLEEAIQLLATDAAYAPIGDPVENNGFTLRENLSESDDAYVFSFAISINGTPMSYYDDTRDTAMYCGSYVVVWYTEDGIINLWVNSPWIVGAEETAAAPIISVQDALDTAANKYQYVLGTNNYEIEKIRFEYQYVQDRSQWLLRPVWTMLISRTTGDGLGPYYEYLGIDALTGKTL